ncbi:hypothetical protein MUN82_12940 [Hymenobacter aerilatus]|uniref:Uncharacterized protein n=1 Tax=Hymenobacter aerilatus TaxID=2932251 RepID=A0A8T9SSZ5_9BACT|nr:hypothetical protein [Hymenobacter aerilatus]UOR03853.1 hypothetical protein MUN82_12940 [Hymenobacter aerilatus]
MNNSSLLLVIPAFITVFIGFWCVVCKLISFFGWYQLSTQFQVAEEEIADSQFQLHQAKLGFARYNGVIKAAASASGLSLSVVFLFRVGHPPLLIPWSCIERLEEQKFLWSTTYTTRILVGTSSVKFSFSGEELKRMMQPWLAAA